MKKIVILPYAESDIKETIIFYKEKQNHLDIAFLELLNSALKEIEKHPETYPIVSGEIRKYNLHRFPYSIFYVFENEIISILAVFHQSRNPSIWNERR